MAGQAGNTNRSYGVNVKLDAEEFRALIALSDKERRHPRDQAGILLRKALIDCGAIKIEEKITGRG